MNFIHTNVSRISRLWVCSVISAYYYNLLKADIKIWFKVSIKADFMYVFIFISCDFFGYRDMDGSGNSRDGEAGVPRNSQPPSTKKLQQTQATVDEVVGIMKVNVEKVLERDQKLSELENRADALQQGATQFEQQAGKLKRKYWWKNLKMMIIIGIICVIILIIIIGE